jgi:hypothetical protein
MYLLIGWNIFVFLVSIYKLYLECAQAVSRQISPALGQRFLFWEL